MVRDSPHGQGDDNDRDWKFGRTEVFTAPCHPEDLTTTQKLAVATVGLLAIVVGIMGLLGFPLRPRDRE